MPVHFFVGEDRLEIMPQVFEGVAELAPDPAVFGLRPSQQGPVKSSSEQPMPRRQRRIGNRDIRQRIAKKRRHQRRKDIAAHDNRNRRSNEKVQPVERRKCREDPSPYTTRNLFGCIRKAA